MSRTVVVQDMNGEPIFELPQVIDGGIRSAAHRDGLADLARAERGYDEAFKVVSLAATCANGKIENLGKNGAPSAQQYLVASSKMAGYRDALNARGIDPDGPVRINGGGFRGTPTQAIAGALGGSLGALERNTDMNVEGLGLAMIAPPMFDDTRGAITTTTYPPDSPRDPRVALALQRAPALIDSFGVPVNGEGAAYKYLRETIASEGAAAERAEGSAAAETNISTAEITQSFSSIAAYIPVTEEALADEPTARSYIDDRLQYVARRRLDKQCAAGDGTAPNIPGAIHTIPSSADVTAKKNSGGDNVDNALGVIEGAIGAMVGGEVLPSGIWLHPSVWWEAVTRKDTDGNYVVQPPTQTGAFNLWGVDLFPSPALQVPSAGGNVIGIVGDFIGSADLVVRQDARIEYGLIADDFKKVQLSARVTLRATVAWRVPGNFKRIVREA